MPDGGNPRLDGKGIERLANVARRNDSQDRVLDAAAALFRARGCSATTVRKIAAAAGILPGSLHYRFATKESLLIRDGIDLALLRLFSFGAINWTAQWYSPEGRRAPDQIADAFRTFTGLGVLDDDVRPAGMTEVRGLAPAAALRNEEP